MFAQQPRQNATVDALAKLQQAEQKIVTGLQHASTAFRALATVDAEQAAPAFNKHAETFLKQLHEARELIRDRIKQVGADLPFENVTMRRLIESDLAIQRTAHVHRALLHSLHQLDEVPTTEATAPSPPYMPSPVASTPLAVIGGVASSPPTLAAPITVAVPTSDAAPSAANLSAQVALNGTVPVDDQLPAVPDSNMDADRVEV